MWATRLWWQLRYFGFDAVSVLDGGLPAWKASGRALERYAGRATRRRRSIAQSAVRNGSRRGRTIEAVVEPRARPACLVNALTPAVFRGEGPSSYSRPGRIPGSVNAPWTALIDPDTNRFRRRRRCGTRSRRPARSASAR